MLEDFGNSAAPENCQLLGLCLGAVSPSLAQITQDAYVANQHDNTVSVVDTTKQDVVNTIAVGSMGSNLLGVAETSDGLHVYVMNQRWSTRPRMLSSDTPQLNG